MSSFLMEIFPASTGPPAKDDKIILYFSRQRCFSRFHGGVNKHRFVVLAVGTGLIGRGYLATEAVESAALSLECVHDVKGGYSLPAGMLSVCDSVADDVLEKHFQNASCFLVDET